MEKHRVGILVRRSLREKILREEDLQKLKGFADIRINREDRDLTEEEAARFLSGTDAAMASWGSWRLTPAILEAAPRLKIWVHAAGSVKTRMCSEAWEKGIILTSAAAAIAGDVAELTIGFITIGLRRIIPHMREMAANELPDKAASRSLYRKTVGVISASHVGRAVMALLKPYNVRILLYDPYVDAEQARRLGAELVDLETMARESDVVTCHAPRLEETHHIYNGTHFKLMKHDAIFVNTSRGDNIDEAALIEELEKGRLFALLDVSSPEPARPDSPLRRLPNVVLSPHVAGLPSCRLGEIAVEELCRFSAGKPQMHRVTRDMLDRIA